MASFLDRLNAASTSPPSQANTGKGALDVYRDSSDAKGLHPTHRAHVPGDDHARLFYGSNEKKETRERYTNSEPFPSFPTATAAAAPLRQSTNTYGAEEKSRESRPKDFSFSGGAATVGEALQSLEPLRREFASSISLKSLEAQRMGSTVTAVADGSYAEELQVRMNGTEGPNGSRSGPQV